MRRSKTGMPYQDRATQPRFCSDDASHRGVEPAEATGQGGLTREHDDADAPTGERHRFHNACLDDYRAAMGFAAADTLDLWLPRLREAVG